MPNKQTAKERYQKSFSNWDEHLESIRVRNSYTATIVKDKWWYYYGDSLISEGLFNHLFPIIPLIKSTPKGKNIDSTQVS